MRGYHSRTEESNVKSGDEFLSVHKDDRTQESPSASLSIDVKHAQDLQEANAANRGRRKHLRERRRKIGRRGERHGGEDGEGKDLRLIACAH